MTRFVATAAALVTLVPGVTTGTVDEKAGSRPEGRTVPVEGLVTYDGPLPDPIPVAEAATARHPVEVDPRTKGLKEAVVWLDGAPARPEPSARRQPVQVDQRNFFF